MSGLKPGPISEAKATAKEEADPCGMTARKAKTAATATATATAKEEADHYGMTARKAKAKAKPSQGKRQGHGNGKC